MSTPPDQVRSGLTVVTSAAVADAQTVASAGSTPAEVRAALFAAVPLIVDDYMDGATALALDWYGEIREEAAVRRTFSPQAVKTVTEDDVKAMVAESTVALRDVPEKALPEATAVSLRLLQGGIQKQVASGFWDTMTTNSTVDPEATGWQRFARGGACKFCIMLADRGAVYSEATVNFAAHKTCHCVVGPSFDPDAPRADAMQYVASKRDRTEKERADVRAYLNQHYPDVRG